MLIFYYHYKVATYNKSECIGILKEIIVDSYFRNEIVTPEIKFMDMFIIEQMVDLFLSICMHFMAMFHTPFFNNGKVKLLHWNLSRKNL